MGNKQEIAHTVGILLNLKSWDSLMKLSEDVLSEIYRNYIQNAKNYNHQEDEVIALRTKVLELRGELRNARKS